MIEYVEMISYDTMRHEMTHTAASGSLTLHVDELLLVLVIRFLTVDREILK